VRCFSFLKANQLEDSDKSSYEAGARLDPSITTAAKRQAITAAGFRLDSFASPKLSSRG
jgi:hypothetical protein